MSTDRFRKDRMAAFAVESRAHMREGPPEGEGLLARPANAPAFGYLGGGAGVKSSRLRPGAGFGLGFGAFLASFLPLSLLPMSESMTH